MNPGRQLVILLMALGLLFTAGCAKRAPQLPSQAKAPAEPIPSTLPAEISEVTPPPPPPPTGREAPPPERPKPKAEPHHRRRRPQPAVNAQNNSSSSNNGNTTIAAAHPPANPAADMAIGADVSSAQLFHQKQTTAELLEETEKSLNGLNRTLSHEEEEIVAQIRSYMTQSLNATKEGDFERAYNLATKAHLLSAALVKK
ncbi:MAG TPA: hypothetical protein VKV05_08710 [Terriglobales bacterium]|nr:hypothetical protein [Terriglobales bacterium]